MKYLSLIGFIAILACLGRVEGFCHYVLMSYYDCKNSFANATTIQNTYLIKSYLPDSFYNKTLGSIKTFQAAMDHFRSLFTEIRDCEESWCYCARYYLHYDSFPNYTYYFTDPTLYPQMVSILNSVKTSYKLLNSSEIEKNALGFTFDEFWPGYKFTNDFCTKNDFSWEFFFFYAETFKCEYQASSVYWDCHENYLTLDYFDHSPNSKYPRAALEDFTSCLLTNISKCNANIKRAIGLTYMYEYPKIIQGSNLVSYIDQLAGTNRSLYFKRFYSRLNTGFGTYSFNKKKFEYCAFEKGVSYSIFDSPNLKIEGLALERRLSSNTSYVAISNFTISFISSTRTQKYSASAGSLPLGFDSKKTLIVNGANNQKWLEMVPYKDAIYTGKNVNSMVILDHSLNTTLLVHDCTKQCLLAVIAPTTLYTKGLLTEGCVNRVNNTVVQNILKLA